MKTVITPMGDRHKNGQTVLIESETGSHIEKPRDYYTESAFLSLCGKLEELGVEKFSRPPILIKADNNKNLQKREYNLSTTESGIADYYRRAGMLTFICYLLGSTDMHCENIIAVGDMPVVVDMETLLSGRASRGTTLYSTADSVLRSHLFCNFVGENGKSADVSGISGTRSSFMNVPHVEGRRGFLWDFEKELTEGFAFCYDKVKENREELVDKLKEFSLCRFRQILRPTAVYHAVCEYLSKVSDDKRESVAYSLLSYAYDRDIDSTRREKATLIIKEEVRAVLAGEIPLFYTMGDGKDLLCDGETFLSGYLETTPVELALERLSGLCESDKALQLKLLKGAIDASMPEKAASFPAVTKEFSCAGERIADYITQSRINELPSGFCELTQTQSGAVYLSVGLSLYSGLSGIMCMYAALYRKTGKSIYAKSTRWCLDKLVEMLSNGKEKSSLSGTAASLSAGLGGVVSCLIHTAELTEDREYLTVSKQLVDRASSLNSDNADYLNGIGIWPLLYARLGKKPSGVILEEMKRTITSASPDNTGVAHGAAGLALSMSALKALGCDVTEEQIRELLLWENGYYSKQDNNWKDIRYKDRPGFKSGWCSGAAGIGMARMRILEASSDAETRALCLRDIERARAFLEMESYAKRHSLCCGAASRLIGASFLSVETNRLYGELVGAENNWSFRLIRPADTKAVGLSLMQGLAGVSYALSMYKDTLAGGMLL